MPRARRAVALALLAAAGATALSPARADIEEQRARLPPPAVCADPVTGVWMSKKYYPARSAWRAFTLTIRRADATGRLIGDIENHAWKGAPSDVVPPACAPGGYEWTVSMPAMGTFDGTMHFFGTSWRITSAPCGSSPRAGQYSLDHFSGTIDVTRQELHSLNTDGGSLREDPAVFRRVGCFDEPPPVPLVVPPPPAAPPTGLGCGSCLR